MASESGSQSESDRGVAALVAMGLYGVLTGLESAKPVSYRTFLIWVSCTIAIALGVCLILTPRNHSTSPKSLSDREAEIYTLNSSATSAVVVKIRKSLIKEARITLVF